MKLTNTYQGGVNKKNLYLILSLALILCFMVGCQDKEAMAELEEFKAQAEVEEQNIEIVRKAIEAYNEKNYEVFREIYADNVSLYSPSNSKPTSLEEIIASSKMYDMVMPDSHHEIIEIMAKGDKVVYREIVRGTYTGEFEGMLVTGKRIEFGSILICRIQDGRIVEQWAEYDSLGFMQQLGMKLVPKKGEK